MYSRHASTFVHRTHAAISGMCTRRDDFVTVVGVEVPSKYRNEDLEDAVLGGRSGA